MVKRFTGVVRGTTIELDKSTGLPDGERVTVELEAETDSIWGEGIKRSAGSLKNDEEFGQVMEQIQQDRRSASRPAVDL